MKVREKMARLAKVDPEDEVVIDPDSQCLWLCNRKLGMFQPLDEEEVWGLTEDDKELLRAMRIQRGSPDESH